MINRIKFLIIKLFNDGCQKGNYIDDDDVQHIGEEVAKH